MERAPVSPGGSNAGAPVTDPSYTRLHKDTAQRWAHLGFLQEVVTELHLNEFIALPAFFPHPGARVGKAGLHQLAGKRSLGC